MTQPTQPTRKPRIPKQSWYACAILWAVYMLNANGREIINRLMPYITDSYHLTATQSGTVSMVASLGLMISSMFLPAWSDKKGKGWKRRKLIILFSIGYMLFTALCGFEKLTATFAAFLGLQFIRGFFAGAGDANEVGNTTEWFPKEKSGTGLGVQHSGYPWGSFIGGLLISGALMIFGDMNWRYCFFIFPLIGIVVWAILRLYMTKENYDKFEKATREQGLTPPLENSGTESKEVENALKDCLKNPNVLVCNVAFMLAHVAYYGFTFWLPLYLAYIADYSYATGATLSVIFTITAGLGQIIWGTLSDKFGAKRCLLITSIWYAVGLAIMPLISHGMFYLVACQLFLGCASNGYFVLLYDLLAKSTRPGTQVTAMGVANTGLYLGAAIGSIVAGFLIDLGGGLSSLSGYLTAIFLFAGMLLLDFFIVLFFSREVSGSNVGKDFGLLSRNRYYIALLENEKTKQNTFL